MLVHASKRTLNGKPLRWGPYQTRITCLTVIRPEETHLSVSFGGHKTENGQVICALVLTTSVDDVFSPSLVICFLELVSAAHVPPIIGGSDESGKMHCSYLRPLRPGNNFVQRTCEGWKNNLMVATDTEPVNRLSSFGDVRIRVTITSWSLRVVKSERQRRQQWHKVE